MINPEQYFFQVLEPTLKMLDMHSLDAMYLMARTAMMESQLTHLKQLPDGPALGLMQIEPATIDAIKEYLGKREDIRERILDHFDLIFLPSKLHQYSSNLALNAAFARIKYWMEPEPVPSYGNIVAQAEYWKKIYNTYQGKGTIENFIKQAMRLGRLH